MFYHAKSAMAAFSGEHSADAASAQGSKSRLHARPETAPTGKAIMKIVVSIVLLVAGLLIVTAPNELIITPPQEPVQTAAIGWIGALLGYWVA